MTSIQPSPIPEIPADELAQAILNISKAMEAVRKSALKREALVLLIHDKSKIGKRDIEIVLNNLDLLATTWLKKKPDPKSK